MDGMRGDKWNERLHLAGGETLKGDRSPISGRRLGQYPPTGGIEPGDNSCVRIEHAIGEIPSRSALLPEQIRDGVAQPDNGRIARIAFMPVLHYAITWHRKGKFHQLDRIVFRNDPREPLGDDRQILSARDIRYRTEKVRNPKSRLPSNLVLFERLFEDRVPRALRGDDEVRFRLKLVECHGIATQTRMAAADDADKSLVKKLLLEKAGFQLCEKTNRQIDLDRKSVV